MEQSYIRSIFSRLPRRCHSAAVMVLAGLAAGTAGPAFAQSLGATIPQYSGALDLSGEIATDQPNGATTTATNAFFQALGPNGRTCFTCHQPQDGWAMSDQHIRDRFNADPGEPLFAPIDGATCPTDDISTPEARLSAYSLLLDKGLIRIGLPMPASLQYKITHVQDASGCNTSTVTGLTSPTTGIVSTYRRPLPSTNLGFSSTIMWDGREPNLFTQAANATLIHGQAVAPPTAAQQQQMVSFEGCSTAMTAAACAAIPGGSGIFTAQDYDSRALYLNDGGASGGPIALSGQVAQFFIGINDPFGLNPQKTQFTPNVFTLFNAWGSLTGNTGEDTIRESIARGQTLFNTVSIKITGVAGLNDVLKENTIVGTCGTCHDTPNVGAHSVAMLMNTGVTGAGATQPPALLIGGLPVFTITCVAGPLAGQTLQVTDPGRATITGNCADLGKVKVPSLRGLAARAPYFHNGSAPSLFYVLDFYQKRFGFTLTEGQEGDLENFLNSL